MIKHSSVGAKWKPLTAERSVWFWVRSAYFVGYVMLLGSLLLWYPDSLFTKFAIPPENRIALMSLHVPLRLASIVLVPIVYFASYFTSWHFKAISFATFSIAVFNFLVDCFTIFIFAKFDALPFIYLVVTLRLILMACLLLNFLHSLANDDFTK